MNLYIKIKQSLLIETTKLLINNEIDRFERVDKIIGYTFCYFDIHGEPKNVYQSPVLGLLAIGDDYNNIIPHDKIKSNNFTSI